MLISNLERRIEIVNNKIHVCTKGLTDCYYAYYLIFGNSIEKMFYTKLSMHDFNMEIQDGYYRCIFYYKVDGEINSVTESFEIRANKIINNKFFDLWDQKILDARSLERWGKPVYEYQYLYHFFNKVHIENGIHSISYNGIPIDLNIDIKNKGVVFIFFNGATPRSEKLKLPVFSGLGVCPKDANIICINDPSLYIDKELRLGWYAGSKGQNLQKILLEIIEHIMEASELSKPVFVGGSGGGFASLYYSRKIENSMALVWNAQTNIEHYVHSLVKDYSICAFSSDDNDNTFEDLKLQVDTDLLKEYSQGFENAILYLQNKSDWHLDVHCLPFVRQVGGTIPEKEIGGSQITKRIYLQIDNWGKGHQAPPKDVISSLLNIIKNNEQLSYELLLDKLANYFEL